MREKINILSAFIIVVTLLGCTESSVTNNSQQTPETLSAVEASSGDWCCLGYSAHKLDSEYTEVSNQKVCQNELREFRMQWTGSDNPNYVNWYISDGQYPDTEDDYHKSQKDILLDGGVAGYGLGDQFFLTAEAYDDPNDTPQRYGNLMDVVDCSEPYESDCSEGEYYNNTTQQCESICEEGETYDEETGKCEEDGDDSGPGVN